MPIYPASRTLQGLDQMIGEMKGQVASPRIQQKTWVAKGKVWLPILEDAQEDLLQEMAHYNLLAEAYQSLLAAFREAGLQLVQRDKDTWAYSGFGRQRLTAIHRRRAQWKRHCESESHHPVSGNPPVLTLITSSATKLAGFRVRGTAPELLWD